jgi:hypothetical protein
MWEYPDRRKIELFGSVDVLGGEVWRPAVSGSSCGAPFIGISHVVFYSVDGLCAGIW